MNNNSLASRDGGTPKTIPTIGRLEKEAARNPRIYRLRLTAVAVADDFALTAVQVLPWAGPIVISLMAPQTELQRWLDKALRISSDWQDTHFSLTTDHGVREEIASPG